VGAVASLAEIVPRPVIPSVATKREEGSDELGAFVDRGGAGSRRASLIELHVRPGLGKHRKGRQRQNDTAPYNLPQ
jgi:hypothetical protein